MGYQIFAICNLNSSQDKIKDYYIEHIERVDSLYCKLGSNNKVILSTYMQDSIYNNNIELLYAEYNKVLREDSLRLCSERGLLEIQTKSMIDLHLNKVEHEYSNLTIWAAILTILFLVFSFYSIYKMDEIIQQGNNGLKELENIKEKGEYKIESFNSESEKTINAHSLEFKSFLLNLNENFNKHINEFDNVIKNKELHLEAFIKDKKESIDSHIQSTYKQCMDLKQEAEINIKDILQYQDKLSQQYDMMQQQIDVLTAMINLNK